MRSNRDGLRRAIGAALLASRAGISPRRYTVTLNPAAPLTVYLQVGVGSFTAIYNNGGQPGNNTTINTVSVTVPAARGGQRHGAGDDHQQHRHGELLSTAMPFAACRARSTSADFIEPPAAPLPPLR